MNYFQEKDAWLEGVLAFDEDVDTTEEEWLARVKKAIKDALLESYRNGQKAGLKSDKPTREEEKPTKARFPFLRKPRRQ